MFIYGEMKSIDPEIDVVIHHEDWLAMEEGSLVLTGVESKNTAYKVFDIMFLRRHKVHGKKKQMLAPKL